MLLTFLSKLFKFFAALAELAAAALADCMATVIGMLVINSADNVPVTNFVANLLIILLVDVVIVGSSFNKNC
jgi:hypothetical protein